MKSLFNKLSSVLKLSSSMRSLENMVKANRVHLEDQKILLAKSLINHNNSIAQINSLKDVEFKVFSQWGDDGIIQYLINKLDIDEKIFIEFGVEDYREANTRFLLINDNWAGLVMDGSSENVDYIKKDDIFWKYQLTAKNEFIESENINKLISSEGISGEIGILHIDIDGNDYWIWKAIDNISPVIVIVEYNSIFGCKRPITIPYNKNFYRTDAHPSNLYYGTSILALCDLADLKGYAFVGCNSNGNNAYFVRNDKLGDLKKISVEDGYVESKFRESRDTLGRLTFIDGKERIEEIRGLEVYNTKEEKLELI